MGLYNVSITKNKARSWAPEDLHTTTTLVEMSYNDARSLNYRLDSSQDLDIIDSYSIDEVTPKTLRDWEFDNHANLYLDLEAGTNG